MLSIHNLHKKYLSKEGLTHHALRGINLELGSKGFIVLLGKSGSGKSTLLNILGGLDNFDSGEIIIKDKSTADFKANEWDSYRNTYVGFVFQEFYIIEEYSVGKNIALALELQGFPKERIDERVAEILTQVDLEGYQNRRPNEISGGQKQRIAIARALVKDPQIILADEPTGNLDSETGKLILETLKKLSKEKLVIMVTHDADFAREYGDRIIELKDGEIIRDQINYGQSVVTEEIYEVDSDVKTVIRLPKGRQLTQKMINYLNDLLLNEDEDVFFTLTDDKDYISRIVPELKEDKEPEKNYDVEAILKSESNDSFALKKSSLPFKHAFKLAVSSLFTRKVRLVLMTFLFILSLVLVGVASNFTFYDISQASNLTFEKANVKSIPLTKFEWACQTMGEQEYCGDRESSFTESDITHLKSTYQSISFTKRILTRIDLYDLINYTQDFTKHLPYYDIYTVNTINMIENNQPILRYGDYPKQLKEILITDYLADVFVHYEAIDGVNSGEALIGKSIKNDFIIAGIVKTDYNKYDHLKEAEDYYAFKESNFQNDRESKYVQLYMTPETYESFNLGIEFFGILESSGDPKTGMTSRGIYFHASSSNESFIPYLISGSVLPKQNNEIVLSISALNEYHFKQGELTEDVVKSYLGQTISFKLQDMTKGYEDFITIDKEYKIVGIFDNVGMFLSEFYMDKTNGLFTKEELKSIENVAVYEKDLVGLTAVLGNNHFENTRFIKNIDQLNYKHHTEYSSMLYMLDNITSESRNILYIIGGVVSLFTAFLILTFISTSIAAKQKEIGTLRAIGARGIDVSKIFFTEGVIIAIFASVFANILTAIVVTLINNSITKNFEIPLVLLYVNFISILVVFTLSILVIILSTYIPLKRITLMKPIKAIKNN